VARLLAVGSGRVFSPWRRRAREKVSNKLLTLDRRLEDTAPYLFALLGIQDSSDSIAQMDPQIKRRRTFDAVKRVLLRESLNRPLMLVFEDLHWVDDETQEFLNLLADSISNAPLLLLVNYRVEYRHQWNNKSYYTQIRLEPLRKENAEQMLDMLLTSPASAAFSAAANGERIRPERATSTARGEVGGSRVDIQVGGPVRVEDDFADLKRLIIEKTEGNPFFIEELVQALAEQGIFQRAAADVAVNADQGKSAAGLKLPPTVQAVLASRIDRLGPREKDLLQSLAVVGREFPMPLIRRVVDYSETELPEMIATLQNSEFIYERPAFPEVEYVFKHALTQEVAYNSLLLERRKALHERIAGALETLFADSMDEHLADLSYHYTRSGNDSRAIDYLVRAAEQAQQRSAYSQASVYLEQALTRLNDQPAGPDRNRKEFAIRAGLADSLIVMSGYAAPEYEYQLARRHELARSLGDTTQIFYSLVGMSVLSAFRLELSKAHGIGLQLLGIADHEHDPDMQLQAHGSLANVLWQMGDLIGSRDHAEKGLKLFKPEQQLRYGNEHWRAACQFYACTNSGALGFPDKALRQALEFLAWARERPQVISLLFALNTMANILAGRGEGAQTLKYADSLLALAAEHGFSNWHSFAQLVRGEALVLLAKADEAVNQTKSALHSLEDTGVVIPCWAYVNLACALLGAKRPEEGLLVTAKALEVGASTGNAGARPELYRLRGELLLLSDQTNLEAGEASFRAAIKLASEQCAKIAELRATVSLARLLAKQDRSSEARATLAEIYGWFKEGFDTADLNEAKALLDELSS
jgi:hypothetical protein